MSQKQWKLSDVGSLVGKGLKKLSSPHRSKLAIDEDVERLKVWLGQEQHLPNDVDPEWLTAFVVGTKSLEVAKQKLEAFFTLRAKLPQLFHFSKRDPFHEDFKNASKALKIYFLPKPTPEGYRVLIISEGENFIGNFVHSQCTVRLTMLMETAMSLWPDMTGLITVTDMKGVPKAFLTKMNPTSIAYYFHWFQNAMPLKIKRGVLFNSPTFMNIIVNTLLKPFMKSKMYNRFIITSDGDKALKKFVDEELLPSDYGGKEPTAEFLNDQWNSILEERRDWFMKTSTLVADEEKRLPDIYGTYGIQGTFRRLELD
ncbi:unnamed protein product [Nezara viridula]|uniref:CRAL-TRIO domain-containing protein n=1 Tax=Nezara viridula TaxID=85310 RepID=A0A9P0E2Q1_NEZVI|nr:unnamed protein product [Nezara viridula]